MSFFKSGTYLKELDINSSFFKKKRENERVGGRKKDERQKIETSSEPSLQA